MFVFFFFFQAEDGIRDLTVTGVQTCALPIWRRPVAPQTQGAAGVDSPWAGNREHPLLPRPDGSSGIADGDCGFVTCAVPALALPRTFRRSREKRPGTLGFAPSGNGDGKRNRQFLIHNFT